MMPLEGALCLWGWRKRAVEAKEAIKVPRGWHRRVRLPAHHLSNR